MSKTEFKESIIKALRAGGFTDIDVTVSLFGGKADITARDTRGKKRTIRARLESRWGKETIKLDTVDKDWIDELEMLDAIFDE